MLNMKTIKFVLLVVILSFGMYLRVDDIYDHEMTSNEFHYASEAPFVIPNYYFFWKYHTHPKDLKTYLSNLEKHTNPDYRIQGTYPLIMQGHPTLFPLLISIFPKKIGWHLKDPSSAKFINKTPEGYVLNDMSPKGVQLIKVYRDGSVLLLINGGDARIISVIFGTLMILIIFIVSKTFYNEKIAYMSSIIFSFSPPIVDMIKLSDNESVMVLFLFIAICLYVRAFETKKYKSFILAGLFHGLAMGTKFTAFGIFPIIIIYMMITKKLLDLKILSSFIISFIILSLFSNPVSAIQEVISPSHLKVNGVEGYIANLNQYPIIFSLSLLSYLFISGYKVKNVDKMLIVYLLFFSFMPFLISYRQYVIAPPAVIIFSAVTVRNIHVIISKLSTLHSSS